MMFDDVSVFDVNAIIVSGLTLIITVSFYNAYLNQQGRK